MDLIIGDMDCAMEIKATRRINPKDLKSLRALKEEYRPDRSILIAEVESHRRTEDGIDILPWSLFCRKMWRGEII